MKRWMTALLAGCLLFAAGCDREETTSDPGSAPPENGKPLLILCGSSFLEPTNEMISLFEKETGLKAEVSTGGSEDLLPHVKLREKGDLFITHDPFLDYTKDADAYADHVFVGYVAPVLAVQPGNPKKIEGIADLAREDIQAALSDPEFSTCGEMIEALLRKKGIYDEVMKNVGSRLTKGHSGLGNLLKTKAVDAVVMWNGVAHTFRENLEVVKTPYEYDEEIRVHVIGLKASPRSEDVAKFLAFVRKHGESIFAGKGYLK